MSKNLRLRSPGIVLLCLTVLSVEVVTSHAGEGLDRSDVRVLFLGDSNTAAAHYVNDIETSLLLHSGKGEVPQIVSLGLASETASGLSEKAHPFPRPTVHERLDRVLTAVQPSVVVACYGINDGIYQPFSDERFAAYQQGIRLLIEKAHKAGARIVLLTPPPYAGKEAADIEPREASDYDYRVPFPAYDSVMARYSEWILTLATEERVDTIDIRTPLLAALAESYGDDPIHPNVHGHRVLATAVLAEWGKIVPGTESVALRPLSNDARWTDLHQLVSERRSTYDRKLLWEIGHKRPGNSPEMSLHDATSEAARIDEQIDGLLNASE